ncbi:hypothetical protein MKZ38_000075 [Zalerion maritima]|uniref:Uncharacterized protein n=1 Tax=Zalerion maritima TaxID=339359 RepID=A0AAD5RRV2_9PEZI|nr:hypothetical protein MKZ38_000075 [Zalerion maritima]
MSAETVKETEYISMTTFPLVSVDGTVSAFGFGLGAFEGLGDLALSLFGTTPSTTAANPSASSVDLGLSDGWAGEPISVLPFSSPDVIASSVEASTTPAAPTSSIETTALDDDGAWNGTYYSPHGGMGASSSLATMVTSTKGTVETVPSTACVPGTVGCPGTPFDGGANEHLLDAREAVMTAAACVVGVAFGVGMIWI